MCLRAIRWIGVSASGAMRTGLKRRRRTRRAYFCRSVSLNVLLGVDPEPTLGWLLPDAIPVRQHGEHSNYAGHDGRIDTLRHRGK